MDYHAIHGHDIASFDTSGTHRLPTVAASQALLDLEDDSSAYVSTGLDDLDKSLQDGDHSGPASTAARHAGFKRRQVTELWGPPGSGKTAIGIQAAASTICSGKDVIWIDCFQQLHRSRVSKVLKHVKLQKEVLGSQDHKPGKLTHYSCLTLPHLMALISRPSPKNTDQNVALVVVDSASALINSALPRAQDRSNVKTSKGPNTSTRRLQALQAIITSLQKVAATKNSAVLVLSQCATKMYSENGAAIVSALNARVWEQGISTRLVLFRDWMWAHNKSTSIFLMALQKLDGKTLQDTSEPVCAFTVEAGGTRQVQYQAGHPLDLMARIAPQKRKLDEAELEVPDSEEDEDYGWAEEDEADLPPPPPQWQGSEDIILGQELGHSEDEYTDEEQLEADSQASGQPEDEETGP